GVDGNDGVQGIFQDGRLARFTFPQGILRAFALNKLADLAADGDERVQQIRIGGAPLAGEELDNADRFTSHANGEAAAAGQVRFVSTMSPREIRIVLEVFNPRRFTAGPNAAGQTDMRSKAHGPATCGESLQFLGVSMPNVLAA